MRDTGTGGGVRLRLFAAMQVPGNASRQLQDYADSITSLVPGSRVVDAARLHLTYAFLGDVAEEYVPAVARQLDAVAATVPGATLCSVARLASLGGGGAVGLEVDLDLLTVLDAGRDRFVDAVRLYAPGVDDRRWRPHVTLARPGSGVIVSERQARQLPAPSPLSWVTAELRLYASLPGPAGHQHRVLHAAPFGVAAPRN